MKRILKKVMPALLTLAMVFTMVAVPSVKAKAADGDYYILGNVPSATWDTGSGAKMKDEGNGKYTYTFSASVDQTFMFKVANASVFDGTNWDSVISDGNVNGGNFNIKATAETVKITYDKTIGDRQGVSFEGAVSTNTFTTGKFNVAGDEGLTGTGWIKTANLMTESNGVYSITFTNIAAGSYKYKILEDQENQGWDSAYVCGERNVNGNGVLTVPADKDGGNVTISINGTTKIVTVTVTAAQGSGDAGQGSGNAGQGSGDAGQGSGDAGQGSGNAGQGSGDAGQGSGDATNDKAEKNTVKIYAKVSSEWKTVNAYAWKDGEGFYKVAEWPGTAMTSLGDGWYVIEIPTDINSIIFNNGNGVQTDNITLTAGKAAAFTVAADGKFEETNVPLNYKGGDNNNMVVYIMMMLAGAGLAAVAIAKRRQATK